MKPPSAADRGQTISQDEFILLNEEIRSLIQAGVPLDVGLRGTASRVGGRLSALSERLAMRLEKGASLEDALAAEGDAIPAVYRSLLEAGLRSGRVDEVLRSVSHYAASMRDLTAEVRRMLIYPTAVVVIAYILFVGLNAFVTPRLILTYELFKVEPTWWINTIQWLHATVGLWGPGIPIVIAAILIGQRLWNWIRNEVDDVVPVQPGAFSLVPGFRGVIESARSARFAHLMAILAEYKVPFPEAMRLSAAGTGDARLVGLASRAAESIEKGQPLARAVPVDRTLPAVLRWLMLLSVDQGTLPSTMRQAAELYEQRAVIRAEWIQRVLPSVLVIVLGGGITLLYALSVFLPMQSVWRSLST